MAAIEEIGISFDEFIDISLEAMREIADEIRTITLKKRSIEWALSAMILFLCVYMFLSIFNI